MTRSDSPPRTPTNGEGKRAEAEQCSPPPSQAQPREAERVHEPLPMPQQRYRALVAVRRIACCFWLLALLTLPRCHAG